MVFLFDKQKKALTQEIQELQARIDQMIKDREPIEQRKLNLIYDDVDASIHVFDWAAVNAFSIERQIKQEQGELIAYTIIGFIREDGGTGEWSYICSLDEHNRLAEDFALYVVMKNQPKPTKAPRLGAPTPNATVTHKTRK